MEQKSLLVLHEVTYTRLFALHAAHQVSLQTGEREDAAAEITANQASSRPAGFDLRTFYL